MNFATLHRLQTLVTRLLQILNRRAAQVQKVQHTALAAATPPANLLSETMGCRLQDSTVGARVHGEEPGVCSEG